MTTKGKHRSRRPRGRAAGDFLFWLVGAALLAGMLHALTRETAAPQSPSQEEIAARVAPVGRVTLSAPAAPAQTRAPAAGQAASAGKPAEPPAAGAGTAAAEARAGEGSLGAPPADAEAPTGPPPVEAAPAELPEEQPAEDTAAASAAPAQAEPAPAPGSRPPPPEGMIWIRRGDLPGRPYELRPAPPGPQR